MAQMNISIPDTLKLWVESRVAEGSYSSSSDYLRDLVRLDQRRIEQLDRLRAEILAGQKSGFSTRDPFDHLEALRLRAKENSPDRNAA